MRVGWVGLYNDWNTWTWSDGSSLDKQLLRVGMRDSYTRANRALIQMERGDFLVVTDAERAPFICKTAKGGVIALRYEISGQDT